MLAARLFHYKKKTSHHNVNRLLYQFGAPLHVSAKEIQNFKSIKNQQHFMDSLFTKFQLNSLEDWSNISKKKIIENGGQMLIKKYYSRDMVKLFTSLYPNYPWKLSSTSNLSKFEYFQSIENQREFMNKLYKKFGLKSLDEWLKISIEKIRNKRGEFLLSYYANNIEKLLISIYPNHQWKFDLKNDFFQSIENQILFLNSLQEKLKLNSLNDWLFISTEIIQKNGGEKLISFYSYDKEKLLSTIYPDHFWIFQIVRKSFNSQMKYSIENQRNFMDYLFFKLQFTSMNQFITLSKKKFIENGGYNLLVFYSNNMKKLLLNIYPNYQWNFELIRLKNLNNHSIIMEKFFKKLKLNYLDEFLTISKLMWKKNGAFSLLSFYSFNLIKLLTTIYPNFPFNFEIIKITRKKYFQSIKNQQKYMENLFIKLKLNSFDDWIKIKKTTFIFYKGKYLLEFYSYDKEKLLSNIFPNYPWKFLLNFTKISFHNLNFQRNFMDNLGNKLNLQSLNDWLKIKRISIIKNGGKYLLVNCYLNDIKKLLSTIYYDHNWNFNDLKYKSNGNYFNNFQFHSDKINNLKKKFNIEKKNDWFRISNEINLIKSLKLIYPNEKWKKNHFQNRSKKTNQRLLFIQLQNIFKYYYLLEDYKHPHMNQNNPLEFDIFIPSFNLAFEYQGEHHYNDIQISMFDRYQVRDKEKKNLSLRNHFHLVLIPYWWNPSSSPPSSSSYSPSSSSLFSTILRERYFFFTK